MNTSDIAQLKTILSSPKKIVIVPHKNPDGDAMGSSLGLCHYLTAKGHEVVVIAPNDYPQFLKWMPGNEEVMIYEYLNGAALRKINESDLIFTLDFNELSRTGEMQEPLRSSNKTMVMIDHHQQPDSHARFMYSDPSICSTCQMIYHFLEMMGDTDAITPEIASCLYAGIMTDTGSFRFASTTSTTHRVIADLIDKGAQNSDIHINIYDNQSYSRLQLLGQALNNLQVIPELSTAYITLSQDELDRYNFKKGDTEGVVNYGLSVEGVKFALIFIEHRQEGIVKISLRSKFGFDVNKFARKHFNGGGHINAAGGRSEKSLEQTVEEFISILPIYKDDLKS